MKYFLLGIVLGFVIALTIYRTPHVEAQDKDVKPYEVGLVSVPMQTDSAHVYKLVHQGCELFVVTTGKYGQSPAVAISTGRGCK